MECGPSNRPSFQELVLKGYKKGKLRAHSDYYPNRALNDWALSFWEHADIMCEAKMKNLASLQVYEQYLYNKDPFMGYPSAA